MTQRPAADLKSQRAQLSAERLAAFWACFQSRTLASDSWQVTSAIDR